MAKIRAQQSVLFVDDHGPLAVMGHRMLTRLGYAATHCTCSAQALERFRATPEHFDLVVTDLNMPHMDGTTLARHLWHIRPRLPIILCTGMEMMNTDQARLLGFEDVLTKPFGLDELLLAVERALSPGVLPKT